MLQIVIAQRGWVFVGVTSREGDQVVISNASIVRRWGTREGLGQLAKRGPTLSTVLDDCGVVNIHVLAIVASINCEEEAWQAKLVSKGKKTKRPQEDDEDE